MRDAGLIIRVDAIGNTFGLWEGSHPAEGKTSMDIPVDKVTEKGHTCSLQCSFLMCMLPVHLLQGLVPSMPPAMQLSSACFPSSTLAGSAVLIVSCNTAGLCKLGIQ